MSISQSQNYAGDVSPGEAFEMLSNDAKAVLVDVRTQPEWQFVGVPDLSNIDKTPVLLSWQAYPSMAVAPDFAATLSTELSKRGAAPDTPILFLCRSGARSRSAAVEMSRAGWGRCYNVVEGFEGDLDSARRRGSSGGWKARGMPWVQT